MTKVKGDHILEWGADYHRWRDDLLLVGDPPGAFAFVAGTTALNSPTAPKAPSPTNSQVSSSASLTPSIADT